jgi:hypothetical protein
MESRRDDSDTNHKNQNSKNSRYNGRGTNGRHHH